MAVTAAETAARHVASHGILLNGRTQMRKKIGLFAVAAALTLVGVGAWMEWVISDSQARPPTATDPINPTQLTINAKTLPIATFVDYSLHFAEQH
jgi:hypothetical protein